MQKLGMVSGIALCLLFAACGGAGEQGPQEQNGKDGQNSKDGQNNKDGTSEQLAYCKSGYFGPEGKPCTCVNGICKDGIQEDGTCSKCTANYWGPNCDKTPTCVNGGGIPKQEDGTCSHCQAGFSGKNCDTLALETVTIGDQIWSAKNMAGTFGREGASLTCYANTDADTDFVEKYGCIYSLEDALKVCPAGWHLPSKAEFESLLSVVGTNDNNEKPNPAFLALVAKDSEWIHDYQDLVTNSTAFGALPAGLWGTDDVFHNFGYGAYFWSATEQGDTYYMYSLVLVSGGAFVPVTNRGGGFSVRCLKDSL